MAYFWIVLILIIIIDYMFMLIEYWKYSGVIPFGLIYFNLIVLCFEQMGMVIWAERNVKHVYFRI